MPKNRTWVFDLDGTIFRLDTTTSFIYYVIRNSFKKKLIFCFYLILLNFRPKKYRYMLIGLLKGYKKGRLAEDSRYFVDSLIKSNKVNEYILKRLKKSRKKIIISAGLDILVNKLANIFNCDTSFSSSLEYSEGVCTGRLEEDILKTKYKKLVKVIGNSQYFVFTDNIEDQELVKNAEKAYVVANTIASKKKWENISQKFVSKPTILKTTGVWRPRITRFNHRYSYIPGMYYFYSRDRYVTMFAVLLKEILPALLLYVFSFEGFIVVIFSYLSMLSLYEIPNLFNDYFSIKHEELPTLKIQENLKFNVHIFVGTRLLFSSLILVLLPVSFFHKVYFTILAMFTLTIFFIHNKIVKKKNRIVTFALLRILKSFSFSMLFLNFLPSLFYVVIVSLTEHIRALLDYGHLKFALSFSQSALLLLVLNFVAIVLTFGNKFLSGYILFLTFLTLYYYLENFFRQYILK